MQNKFNDAQVKINEVYKVLIERGPMFNTPQEDMKAAHDELVSDMNERFVSMNREVIKIYKAIEQEVGLIDKKLIDKVEYSAIPKIQGKFLIHHS